MSNDWFSYDVRKVDGVATFIDLALNEMRAPWLFRGHADIDWELEPAIDRSEFTQCHKQITRATYGGNSYSGSLRIAPGRI